MSARKAPPAEPLSRERIIDAALAIADESGLAGLTMRAVARRLDAEAMSLYNHVDGREGILDGLVDVVYRQWHMPDENGAWKDELRTRSRTARAAMARHPWSITLMNSRRSPGMVTLQHLDATIGVLLHAEFPLTLVAHTLATVDAHLYGFAVQESSLPFDGDAGVHDVAEQLTEANDFAALPHLAAFMTGHAMRPGYDFGDEFEHGLALVLDGIEREWLATRE